MASYRFFFRLRTMFYSPLSLSIFIFLLFHNFIIFPPQFFLLLFPPLQCYYSPPFLNSLLFLNFDLYPPPPHFWFPSSTIFIIFPLQSWFSFSSTSSFILYVFPFSNPRTSYRPYIYPRLNFFSTLLRE